MKYLIVGLGNIGSEYAQTRHNVGFDALDMLAKQHDAGWKTETLGDIAVVKYKSRSFILLKPGTYMNLSGKAVRYWLQKEKLDPENLLILTDELNLPLGKIRLRGSGSDGGHNGLKSIQELLGTQTYARLRIGIGDEFAKGKQVNYVLGKWSTDDWAELQNILERCGNAVLSFGTVGLDKTMNEYNKAQ
jgi:peptidyl-tRNA hydrolase, PTH1 family